MKSKWQNILFGCGKRACATLPPPFPPFVPSPMHRIFLLNGPRSPKSARPSPSSSVEKVNFWYPSLGRRAAATPHLFLVDFITGRLGEQHEKSRRNQGDKHKSDFDAAAGRQHKLSH